MPDYERNSRKIIRRLKSEGWREVAVVGSHHKFARGSERGSERVTVPHPRKDISPGVARQIAKTAGWMERGS